jgi:thiol-disulfide isomerase/thioredoxin
MKAIILLAALTLSLSASAQDLERDSVVQHFLSLSAKLKAYTKIGVKSDGSFYYPKVGEKFPTFSDKDVDGNTWTSDSIRGRVAVFNLWYSGCGPCLAEMPILSEWKQQLPDVLFFSATFHDAETTKRITDKRQFNWVHLIESKDMMAWIGTKGFPFTVVVDKQGMVRYAVHGTSQQIRAEILDAIKAAPSAFPISSK